MNVRISFPGHAMESTSTLNDKAWSDGRGTWASRLGAALSLVLNNEARRGGSGMGKKGAEVASRTGGGKFLLISVTFSPATRETKPGEQSNRGR